MKKRPHPSVRKSGSPHDAGDYKVGYRRPPLHTQFKPGQSGNPKGRPRGQKNLGTLIREAANERVTLREGERTRQVTKLQAFVIKNFNGALASDEKAASVVMTMLQRAGLFDQEPASENQPRLSDREEKIFVDYLRRQGLKPKGKSIARKKQKGFT